MRGHAHEPAADMQFDDLEYSLEGMQIEPDDADEPPLPSLGTMDEDLDWSPRSAARPILNRRPDARRHDPGTALGFSVSPDRGARSESSTTLSFSAGSLGTPSTSLPKRMSLSRSLRGAAGSPSSYDLLRGGKDAGYRFLKQSKPRTSYPGYKHPAPYAPRRYSAHAAVRAPFLPASPVSADAAATAAATILATTSARHRRTFSADGEETDEEVPVCLGKEDEETEDEDPSFTPTSRRPSAPPYTGPRPALGWGYGPARPSGLSHSLHCPPSSSYPTPLTSCSPARPGLNEEDSDSKSEGDENAFAQTPPTVVSASPPASAPAQAPQPAAPAIDSTSAAKAVNAIRTSMGGSANCPAFVTKLWYLLDTPAQYQKYICWSHAGDKILIAADTATSTEFATQVLPTLYRHNNNASFIRQLNLYGFQRISNTRGLDAQEIQLAVGKSLLSPAAASGAIAGAVAAAQAQVRADTETAQHPGSPLSATLAAEAATAHAAAAALTPGLTAATLYGPHHCFAHPRFQRGHQDWLPLLKPKSSKKPRGREDDVPA